jgi:hypothetical protein
MRKGGLKMSICKYIHHVALSTLQICAIYQSSIRTRRPNTVFILIQCPCYLYAQNALSCLVSISLILPTHIRTQPIHALRDPRTIHRTTRHNTPIPIFQLAQPQRLADLTRPLGARLVLLVGKHEQRGVAQFFFVEHGAQFFRGGGEAVDVCAVDDEDYRSGVGVVATPVGADGGLATEVLGCVSDMEISRRARGSGRTQTLKFSLL